MLMAFPPSLTIQPYLAKAQGIFPSCSSDCQPGLTAKTSIFTPLPPKRHASSASDAQGHVTECSRPGLDSGSRANAPCMLQIDAYVPCSANREQQQTNNLGGNHCFAHVGIILADQRGLHAAKPFSRLSLLTDSKSW